MQQNARSTRWERGLDGLAPAELLALAGEAVRRAAGEPLDMVDGGRLVDSVVACQRLETRMHAEKLRRAAEVERRNAYRGRAHNSVNLWVGRLGVSRAEAKTLVDSALVLERLPETAARHAEGSVGAGHVADAARTIAQLDRLTAEQPSGDGQQVEDTAAALDRLVAGTSDRHRGAGGGGPVDRQALRHKLEGFQQRRAPELLAEREQRLRARRSLRLRRDPRDADQAPLLDGRLAPSTYAKARTVLHALARKHAAGDPRTFEQRCHDALDRLLDLALASGELPDIAGDQPRVLLIVRADNLHDRPGAPAATLDGYGDICNATARQMCCDAETTTIVMSDDGQVLHAGRDRRQPNRAQRRATFARDQACIGCRAPLAYCQIHHITWWRHGGRTDISNLVAVCWDCHQRIHHAGWQVTRQPDGRHKLRPPRHTGPSARPPDYAEPPERRASRPDQPTLQRVGR
jgi:hypothetical protein